MTDQEEVEKTVRRFKQRFFDHLRQLVLRDERIAELEKQNNRYREKHKNIKIMWEEATEATDNRHLTYLMFKESLEALEGESSE